MSEYLKRSASWPGTGTGNLGLEEPILACLLYIAVPALTPPTQ